MGAAPSVWPPLPQNHPRLQSPAPEPLVLDAGGSGKEFFLCEGCGKKCATARSRTAHKRFCEEYSAWKVLQTRWRENVRAMRFVQSEPPQKLVFQLLIQSGFSTLDEVLGLVKISNHALINASSNWLLSTRGKNERARFLYQAAAIVFERGFFPDDGSADSISINNVNQFFRKSFGCHLFKTVRTRRGFHALASLTSLSCQVQGYWLKTVDLRHSSWLVDGVLDALLPNCPNVSSLNVAGCSKLTPFCLIRCMLNFPLLELLDISATKLNNEALVHVAMEGAHLSSLNLTGCDFAEDSSATLMAKYCPNMKRLRLSGCTQLTLPTILAFTEARRRLVEVDVSFCDYLIVENSLRAMGKAFAPSLERFSAASSSLNNSALLCLSRCTRLSVLNVSYCPRLTDENMPYFFDRLTSLTDINFCGCELVGDATVKAVAVRCAYNLRNLNLKLLSSITDVALKAVWTSCPSLETIILDHCVHITHDGVESLLQNCSRLSTISLVCVDSVQNDTILPAIQHVPLKLQHLNLACCTNVTDQMLLRRRGLATVTSLSYLNLTRTQCSKEGVAALGHLHSVCDVVF